MPTLYLLFNHTLTAEQEADARKNWGVEAIIEPPDEISSIWAGIKPDGELDIGNLRKVTEWLGRNATPGDYVLVQGEFGATYYIVDFCFLYNLTPIYATTERVYEGRVLDNGGIEQKHIFRHINFRRYRRFKHE